MERTKSFLRILLKPFRVGYYLGLRIIKFIHFRLLLIKYRFLGRPVNHTETFKAKSRRIREGFFEKYCQGKGLDIGYGGDLIKPDATGFDLEHGDGAIIKKVINNKFDYVYSSHLLEHLFEPEKALNNWWKVLKPNGYLILYIPHRDLYEKKTTLPSKFNSDHKFFYLLGKEDPPQTKDILKVIEGALVNYKIIYSKVCDEGYRSNGESGYPEGEYSIEIVIQKI